MGRANAAQRVEMSGVERLSLRVSEMINHPIAQIRRWVTIHRLDTDGGREWEEVVGILAATEELDVTFEDDGAVTVRWEPIPIDDRHVDSADASGCNVAPF